MAVSIKPKSVCRRVTSIQHGYGEVPVVETPEGKMGWGLPGAVVTFCRDEAVSMAKRLDIMIRNNLKNSNHLCN